MSKGNVKRALVLLLSLLAVSAWADDLLLARRMIDGALAELATHSKFTVVLLGKETDNKVETGIRIDLAYNYTIVDNRPVAKIELLNIRGDGLVSRVAGDGERVWNYNVAKNSYSSSEYGTGQHIGKERTRLFQVLAKRSDGAQTFISRLMLDTFARDGRTGSRWNPWRPNSTVTVGPSGNIICDSNIPHLGRMTYILAKDRLFGYRLVGVKYYEESQISGRLRTIEWEATIYTEWVHKDTSYIFVPPKGSRSISVNEARSGGGL